LRFIQADRANPEMGCARDRIGGFQGAVTRLEIEVGTGVVFHSLKLDALHPYLLS